MISVIMHDNVGELEALLQISQRLGVQHQMTLLSTGGDGRHDRAQRLPPPGTGARLLALKKQFPHFITFSGYLEAIDRFLDGDVRTPCWAGERFLNVDHMGDVSPCIEKLHLVRRKPAPRSLGPDRRAPAQLRRDQGVHQLHDRLPRLRRGDERRAQGAQLGRVLRQLRQPRPRATLRMLHVRTASRSRAGRSVTVFASGPCWG